MSPPRVTYREDALPRTHLSHLAVGRAPKELERRSDVPLASLPRRARGGYHGRIYYPYGRIISGGSTGHGCDATRRDPQRTCTLSSSLLQACVRTQRAFSRATLLLFLSRTCPLAIRRQRTTATTTTVSVPGDAFPSPRFYPLVAASYSREGVREKERNDNG